MNKLLSLVLIFTGILAQAQDGYHTYLNQVFENDYNLPQGEWVFFDSEMDIYDATIAYGGSFSLQTANNQAFDNKVRGIISNAGSNPWDAGWKVSNQQIIQTGDKLLAVFYLRSVNGSGEVNFFIENNTTYAKEVYLQLPLSEEWRLYFVPFESMNTYAPGACGWGFHLANQAQTIEIGGFTAINFDSNVNIEDLPSQVNNQFYGGYEADAPWRSAAADRIDNLRKADLNISVQRTDGSPIENAAVEVKMLEHEFGFGSAVVASRIANNPAYNVIYENKITNLDGQGHGFKEGVSFIPCRVIAVTWGDNEPHMKSRLTLLESGFSGLGAARSQVIVESVDRAVAQTLPGSKLTGTDIYFPAQVLAPILPTERVESPWETATMLCRTEDNKAYPIETGSNQMDFHTYVLIGPPGTGKSVTMTTQLLNGAVLRPGLEELPVVGYIDVGYTSKGPFNYYRSLLPKNRRHEVVHEQLRNSKDHTINIFDTPLGCDYPPADELSSICAFVELFVQNDDGSLPEMMAELIVLLVKEAYRSCAEKPKRYNRGLNSTIDQKVIENGFETDHATTWRDLRDRFFKEGMLYEAELCHLQAVPFWMDLTTYLSDSDQIKSQYGKVPYKDSDMTIVDLLGTKIEAQSRQYENLGDASTLNFSSARMIGLDLQNVAVNDRATEVYYLLARFMIVKGWFMDHESVSNIQGITDQYREYHIQRLKRLKSSEKWLFYDEVQRASMAAETPDHSRVMKVLMRDNREIRKYGVRLILASQSIDHMPSELKKASMWSMLIIQGAKNKRQRQHLKDLFGLTDFGMKALEERVNGPVPGVGATVLMLAETKHGRIEQTLVISASAIELWAAPSTAHNSAVCAEVIEALNSPDEAVRRLAQAYPSGSCEKEIKRRLDDSEGDLTEPQIIREIIDEVVHMSTDKRAA